jgi:ABC-2 type transport system permease protein
MFMISPALFPLALMPDWLATIAQFNPVTYAIVLVRSMMSGFVEGSSAALSIVVLSAFVIAMTLLASYVFTREVNKPF